MKTHFRFSLLLGVVAILCCGAATAQDSQTGKNGKLEFALAGTVSLQENLVLQNDITQIEVLGDGSFVTISPEAASVVAYSQSGRQTRLFGSKGKGPFEYLSPEIIQRTDDSITIWDGSENKKFILFDTLGAQVDEYTDFTASISDFTYVDGKIVSLKTGGYTDNVISVFDPATEETRSFGSVRLSHVILTMFEGSEDFLTAGPPGRFLVTYADSPDIHIYSIADGTNTPETRVVTDDDFDVDLSDYRTKNDVQQALMTPEFRKAGTDNSRTLGIYSLDDFVVVATELGKIRVDERAGRLEFSNRYMKITVYDQALDYLDEFVLSNDWREEFGQYVVGHTGNQLLFSATDISDDATDLTRRVQFFQIQAIKR